jgi:hypothetical protein
MFAEQSRVADLGADFTSSHDVIGEHVVPLSARQTQNYRRVQIITNQLEACIEVDETEGSLSRMITTWQT